MTILHRPAATLAVALGIATAGPAAAATITDGFTFAVASGVADSTFGTHFHSSTGGDYGNPAGKAEVGSFESEEVRGLSEYDLAGLGTALAAFVTFDVHAAGGLFAEDYPDVYAGPVDVWAYAGDNAEGLSDYQTPATAFVGRFSTVGLGVGDVLSFDITSLFNTAIGAGQSSLGIRLQGAGGGWLGAFTFDDFRLTTTDETTPPPAVALPASALLLATGLAGLALSRRRARAIATD